MTSKSRFKSRLKRNITLASSSDDNETNNVEKETTNRKSVRIHLKQQKPNFTLPTRDIVWSKIPDETSPSKSLKQITPSKTVNNFTKVYNSYNFDDYEDTSDDASGFDECSSSESKCSKKEKHRIKSYHKRIQFQSSSSDEEESLDASSSKPDKSIDSPRDCRATEKDIGILDESVTVPNIQDSDVSCVSQKLQIVEKSDSENDSDTICKTPSKKKSKTSIILSDDSEEDDYDYDGVCTRLSETKGTEVLDNKDLLEKDSNDNVSKNDDCLSRCEMVDNQTSKAEGDPICDNELMKTENCSIFISDVADDSEEDTGDESDYSSSDSLERTKESRSSRLSAKKKRKRDSMFQRLKEAQAKRRHKNGQKS